MFKKIVFTLLIIGTSFSSLANWATGVSYINLSDKAEDLSISLSGVVGAVNYKVDTNSNFSLIPELRLGTGVKNDSFSLFGVHVNVEIDSFVSLSLKGQYKLNDVYLFASPSYTNLKITSSLSYGGQTISESESSWEFGLGGGIGYQLNETTSAELSYDQYDGTDILSFGVRVKL